ncbi:uncharacterized protein [Periplaneta americana]|uniref:uncharacterized protein n=1 Tax=Periplaneta americana TaxID=6978 RepID=UPI0037E75459
MASFLLVFALCLVVQSAVAEDCKTGRSVVEDIDISKMQNSWKVVYINNKELLAKFSCWICDCSTSPDGVHKLQISIVDNSAEKNITTEGTYEKWNGHFLNCTLPDNGALTSVYNILAVEYGRYKIVGVCLDAIHGQPAVGIAFLTWTPDEDDLKAAKEMLPKIGLDFKDFEPFCPLSEIKE